MNGLSRYKDDLICAKSKGDGTDMHIFSQTINLIDENTEGPPIMTLGHLGRVVRKMTFEKGIVLQVETFQIFHIRKNGSINVSDKKSAMMRLLVDMFCGDEVIHVCFCNFWVPKEKEQHSFLRVRIVRFPGDKGFVATKLINQQSYHCRFLVRHIDWAILPNVEYLESFHLEFQFKPQNWDCSAYFIPHFSGILDHTLTAAQSQRI